MPRLGIQGDAAPKKSCRPRGTRTNYSRFPTAEAVGFLVLRPRREEPRDADTLPTLIAS